MLEQPYRPDQSQYLVHFTKDGKPFRPETNAAAGVVTRMTAMDRLVGILEQRKILAFDVPWVGRPAVCFTECPWASMVTHAKQYSPFGVGFTKPHVFAAGGGPVYYVRADHWAKQQWEPHLKTFVTPFWPPYRPQVLKGSSVLGGKDVDYSHEREWRVPHDFSFELAKMAFVIVDTYEDLARFPKGLKDAVGRENFLIMDVYRQVERLWPVHRFSD